MSLVWWLLIDAVVAATIVAFLWRMRRKGTTTTPLTQAKQRFHAQRERLEAKFIQLAAAHANPKTPLKLK